MKIILKLTHNLTHRLKKNTNMSISDDRYQNSKFSMLRILDSYDAKIGKSATFVHFGLSFSQ